MSYPDAPIYPQDLREQTDTLQEQVEKLKKALKLYANKIKNSDG